MDCIIWIACQNDIADRVDYIKYVIRINFTCYSIRLFNITYVLYIVFLMDSTGLEASREPGVKEDPFCKNFFGASPWKVIKNTMWPPDWKDIKVVQG